MSFKKKKNKAFDKPKQVVCKAALENHLMGLIDSLEILTDYLEENKKNGSLDRLTDDEIYQYTYLLDKMDNLEWDLREYNCFF